MKLDSASVAIIKPIGIRCNMRCSYCYASGNTEVMTDKVLRQTISFLCRDQQEAEFIWHGGEPLLAGMDFFRRIAEIQDKWTQKGCEIANFVQTNGTILTKKWADLLASLGFWVGISMDGTKTIHNLNRKFKNNLPSFSKTMKGITEAQSTGIFNGVICCIGTHSIGKHKEIMEFFAKTGIKSIKFSRIYGPFEDTITQDQFVDFLLSAFQEWIKIDDPDMEVINFKSVINLLLGGDFQECIYMGRCDRFVTVYGNGSVYSCDNMPVLPEFCLGNMKQGRKKIATSSGMQKIIQAQEKLKEKCERSGCSWSGLCKGWCLANAVRNDSCSGLTRLFTEVSSSLRKYQLMQ